EEDAIEEENKMKALNFDTYLRGVSAYSTLGWFKDPLLSSMLRYKDHDLVNTLIHETVHATLYIKSSADFNERMAVFLGGKGTELFYLKKEGPESKTLKLIEADNYDEKLFSEFIGREIQDLENWYSQQPQDSTSDESRLARLGEIQEKFKKQILPKMLTTNYAGFPTISLNNARLLLYKTYLKDLKDFETLFQMVNNNFH